jgi:hypothetical protein
MRRTSACLGLLFVMLGWCMDEPLQQRVSYDKPAQTLKALLRDLSAQTNLKLYAAPPLDAEIVLVAVQEMPLKELMEHIAYVVDGEWIAESERQHRLARTPKVIAKRRQEDREKTLAELREMLASEEFRRLVEPLTREEMVKRMERLRKQLRDLDAEMPGEDDIFYKIYELYNKELEPLKPERRLLFRILQQVDLQTLIDIPLWERRVFSNTSGRYLLPLRVELASLLQQWKTERETFCAVIDDPHYQSLKDESRAAEYFWWFLDRYEKASPINLPAKVFLEVHRYEGREGFAFSLCLADEQNRRIATDYYALHWDRTRDESRMERLLKEDDALTKPVEWSAETQQWLDAWGTVQSAKEVKPFPELLDPAKHEPLQFVATDVLRSYARHRNLSLIALLDDEMLWWVHRAFQDDQRVSLYLRDTREISVTDTAVRIKPHLSSQQWRPRENREAASQRIRQIVQRGYFGVEDALDAVHQPNFALAYFRRLGTGASPWLMEPQRSLLPLMKRLLQGAESDPEGTVELPLSSLSPKQVQELERVMYHASGNVSRLVSDKKQDDSDGSEHPLARLPHAHFPNGLPRDAVLVCRIETEDGVLSERSGVGVWGRFYDVADLQQFFDDKHSDYLHIRHKREFIQNSLLLPAQRQGLTLSLRVEPYNIEIISTYEVYGYRPTQGLKPIRWEQLPPEWLKPPNPQEASEDP